MSRAVAGVPRKSPNPLRVIRAHRVSRMIRAVSGPPGPIEKLNFPSSRCAPRTRSSVSCSTPVS